MPLITIVRTSELPDRTLGTIYYEDEQGVSTLVGHTVEDAWKDNQKYISCIPKGEYLLEMHNSQKHGPTVAFVNESLNVYHHEEQIPKGQVGRSECLIHAGNWHTSVQGCVAVGLFIADFGPPRGLGVSHAKQAMEDLRELWGNRQGLRAIIK